MSKNSLGAKKNLSVAGKEFEIGAISTDIVFFLQWIPQNYHDFVKMDYFLPNFVPAC